ncbi:MAG: type I methionyl aminopeptidase [Candidatus Marinimicrobia bacterium]|nr:type I methionyl aminopeptidase [Candidatus Neomarinimicrobiota bacterium]
MIKIKSPAELERMRASGRLAAQLREAVVARVAPGVTTRELDAYAREWLAQHGARSAFLGYRGYPGCICISVNDEVVHGIGGDRQVLMGDLVSLDFGVSYEGYVGDTAKTVLVGALQPESLHLVQTAEAALQAGIAAARPGNHVGDIGHAVEQVARRARMSVVRDFVGHGVGRHLHEDPQVPNYGRPGQGARLRPGMTLAIEPMLNRGGAAVRVLADGWTVVTRDGSLSAHCEHTVAIGPEGPEILTCTAAN